MLQSGITVEPHRMQLEQRVEIDDLRSRRLVQLFRSHYLLQVVVHTPEVGCVAVGARRTKKGVVFAYADEVDAPCVDTDALDVNALFRSCLQRSDDFLIE